MHSWVWEPLPGVYTKVFQVSLLKRSRTDNMEHYQNNLKNANKDKNKHFTANDHFLNYQHPKYLGFFIEWQYCKVTERRNFFVYCASFFHPPNARCRFKLLKIFVSSLLLSLSFSINWQFQVVEFCTEENHNREAPNMQNQRCNLRSTWEVIRDSEDFKKTTPMTAQPPQPTFSLLQIGQRIVCLVLDKSGSMAVRSMSLGLLDAGLTFVHHMICTTTGNWLGRNTVPKVTTVMITLPSELHISTFFNKNSASSVSFDKLAFNLWAKIWWIT